MRFSKVAVLPFLVAQETCPDQRLKLQCEGICDQDLVLCLESCSDNECQASCNREHASCFASCPCNNNCETGCDRCENPICKAVLVLNTYRV